MALTVYNTLTRKKEPFEPVVPGKVGIYLCGPTVYKPSHIGHAVGPIIFDAIKRYLVHRGYEVTWVVNITDVDDKLIAEAAEQKITTAELASRVTKDYLQAIAALHIDTIDEMPKASEHIDDIVRIIERLIEREMAYVSNGDVYFDVSKDADYGKLSNRRPEEQEGQRDLQSGQKRSPGDFALWKAAKPQEPEEVKFDSPWGRGRPGWHIECSAMAMRYLGDKFDIHGGGLDLVFPHHENEIAQSESATGQPFARYWMHNGLTRINTKKISKSDADPQMQAALSRMTLHNLLENYSGELIRFFVLSTHYRRPIEYSEEEIESKRKGLFAFYRLFERVERLSGRSPYADARLEEKVSSAALARAISEYTADFERSMDDDFNTAGAIASLFELASAINRFIDEERLESDGLAAGGTLEPGGTLAASGALEASGTLEGARHDALVATGQLIAVARLIGMFLEPPSDRVAGVSQRGRSDALTGTVMDVLIQVRKHLRKKKDFDTADLIRNLLSDRNIVLEDRPDTTTWRTG